MKRITKKNKIRIAGTKWDRIGMLLYWHPKSDYFFYTDESGSDYRKHGLIPLHKFGEFSIPLKIKIDKYGNAKIRLISDFDLAVLKIKMRKYGFKNFSIIEKNIDKLVDNITLYVYSVAIKFDSPDESAMFQLYFSEFIV